MCAMQNDAAPWKSLEYTLSRRSSTMSFVMPTGSLSTIATRVLATFAPLLVLIGVQFCVTMRFPLIGRFVDMREWTSGPLHGRRSRPCARCLLASACTDVEPRLLSPYRSQFRITVMGSSHSAKNAFCVSPRGTMISAEVLLCQRP